MSTNIPSQYLPQFDVLNVIVFPIVTVMVMFIVYGFYIALFALCVYLLRQGEGRFRTLYFSSVAVLFVISTSMVAVETAQELQESVVLFKSVRTQDFLPFLKFTTHDTTKTIIYAFRCILPVAANAAADFILIHRCYAVWGSTKRILVPLILASFVVNVISSTGMIMIIIGSTDTRVRSNRVLIENGQTIGAVGLIISAAFNSVLTLLTAGRIWWITRSVRKSKTYLLTTMNKIIFESGMIYPLIIILHLSIRNGLPQYYVPLDTLPVVVIAAAIAPTLIIVRIRLGISAPDNDTITQPPRSSIFLHSIQPTQRSIYFSRLSAANRRLSRLEGIQVKPPPAVHKIAHSI
ncbi:hypothetical protein L218DRAFT_989919 [Marasmius fiardii PR-910]|nr:hypothetical protein L218DRAFT_989919 [Marasmius fiardii PR-910]